MSDRDNVRRAGDDRQINDEREIERLLRVAGPRPEVPGEAAERVRSVVHAHWRRTVSTRKLRRWLVWSSVPLAAAAVWAVLMGPNPWRWMRVAPLSSSVVATLERTEGSVTWAGGPSPKIGSDLQDGTGFETGHDGRVALVLGGGASVRVDTGTRVVLLSASEFQLDRGAVYVDTETPDGTETSVSVRTALGIVRDVGTQFQVRAEGDTVQLSVREGMATIEHKGRSHEAPSGSHLTVQGGTVTTRPISPSDPGWDWILNVAPPFEMEGRLLREYLGWIERETGLRVEYSDESILTDAATVVLHGSVENLRPDESLDAVLPTCGLRHRVTGGSLLIERADGDGR